jgi:hypothetical protein
MLAIPVNKVVDEKRIIGKGDQGEGAQGVADPQFFPTFRTSSRAATLGWNRFSVRKLSRNESSPRKAVKSRSVLPKPTG